MYNKPTNLADQTAIQIANMFVDAQPDVFEAALLNVLVHDLDFYRIAGPVIGAANGVESEDFNQPVHNGIFFALQQSRTIMAAQPGVLPALHFISSLMAMYASKGKFLSMGPEVELATQTFANILAAPIDDGMKEIVKHGWVRWLQKKHTKQVIELAGINAKTDWDPEELMQKVQLSNTTIQARASGAVKLYKIGDDKDDIIVQKPIMPTGIPGIDKALAGGPSKGDSIIGVAPQGAGKTICVCQIGGHWAQTGFKGLIVTTEAHQGPEALQARIVSNFCRIPFSQIKDGVRLNKLTPLQRAAYEKLIEKLSANLRIVHWGDNTKTIKKDYDSTVEAAQQDMDGLDFVCFDWLSGNTCGIDNVKDSGFVRHCYQAGADHIAYAASKHDTINLAFVQATVMLSANKPYVDATMFKECKSMGENFPNGFGITLLKNSNAGTENGDELYEKKQFFTWFKARKGEAKNIPFLRDYQYQHMAPLIR
jgi:hypothetical protein